MASEIVPVEVVGRIRVPRGLIAAAKDVYPGVLSALKTHEKCVTCGDCCCKHETVELTIFGKPKKTLDDSPVGEPKKTLDDSPVGEPKKTLDDSPVGEPKKTLNDSPFGEPKKTLDDSPVGEPKKTLDDSPEGRDKQPDTREIGIQKAMEWLVLQPSDALPPTDFRVPANFGAFNMSPTMLSPADDLQLGAEACDFLLLEKAAAARDSGGAKRQETKQGKRQGGNEKKGKQSTVPCRFCKSNGETPEFWNGHRMTSRGIVTCPILRKFVCTQCGATGDMAHTPKYCPTVIAPTRDFYRPVLNAYGKVKTLKY